MNLFGFIKGLLIQDTTDKTKEISIEVKSTSTTGKRLTLTSENITDNRTLNLPNASDTLVGKATVDVFTNKTFDADGTGNSISNIENADIKAGAAIDASKIADGSVSNAEFQYLNGVTSNIQTQLGNNSSDLSNHLSDASDAHDASAISNVPAGNLVATDVQAALNELQGDIDALVSGSSTASNLGTGAQIFKQQVVNDLQFRSIKQGSNITITQNADEIEIAGPSSADQQLSNLSGTVAFNLDLLPATDNTRLIGSTSKRIGNVISGILTAAATSGAGRVLISSTVATYGELAGNQTAPDASTANVLLRDGSALVGSIGIATIDSAVADANNTKSILIQTGNKTAGTGFSGNISLLTGTSTGGETGQVLIKSGSSVNSGDVVVQSGTSSANSGALNLLTGSSSSSGNSGQVGLETGSVVSGNSGQIFIGSGAATTGSSGNILVYTGAGNGVSQTSGDIELSTGAVTGAGASRGDISLSGKKANFSCPIVLSDSDTTTGSGTINILEHNDKPLHIFDLSGAATLQSIRPGVDGQIFTIININAQNVTLDRLSTGPTDPLGEIETCTGADITTTGIAVLRFIYLTDRWYYMGGQT